MKNADIDVAVKECVTGASSFGGQRCTAIKIIFVHESIADEFRFISICFFFSFFLFFFFLFL